VPAVVANWSDLVGRVRSVSRSADAEGFATVTLDVDQVNDVPGFTNVLGDRAGNAVDVHVRDDQLTRVGVKPGDRIRSRTRLARPDRLFAHPDQLEVLAG
jgi:hypothetical protein